MMTTIYSNANGQVVKAGDVYGDYYYVADSLGLPSVGAWETEEEAMTALDSDNPQPTLEMDADGYRLVECAYCNAWVRPGDVVPASDDDQGWAEAAQGHADGCEWVETRAHRS
jgi:hypothetical protein